ncbi:NADH-quinone oxidoreductase subunit C [Enemella evansiae]|uniref:NADH-quinone oxidoreductase subunit C n=1 Tax=Enemella evansiae TaxID=2016499 RepID=UPI000B96BB3E|nr:NADH-quinone oxidoreductase subunit C [Enemella evansiae]OYN95352.1 NADH-quinone oxidoreductase subunit C [Enemella evansiae]
MSDNKPEGAAPDPRDQPGAESGNAPASTDVEQSGSQAGVVEGRPVEVKHGMWGAGSGDTSGYGRMVRTVEQPGPSARPYGGWFDEVVDRIEQLVPGGVREVVVHRGELTLYVDGPKLPELAQALRDDARLRFEHCASVSGVHYPSDTGHELHSVYHLQSLTHNRRLRLEASCSEAHPHLPSVVAIYPAADWHERETWDMFGIIYDGHPALTRILMPDDWPGHPQRKDYPLGGVPVEYKGATIPPPDQRRSY